jgi:hypothetical protein
MAGESLDYMISELMKSDEKDRLANFLEQIKNKKNTY